MFKSRLIRFILAIGFMLPWLVGICIKLYLDYHGEPTWDWFYFLNPARLIAIIWATFWFALPSFLLGYFGHLMMTGRISWLRKLNRYEQGLILIASAVWGAAGSVPVFFDMFWNFHPVSLLVPFFYPVYYLDDYLYGLATGAILAMISLGIRRYKQKQEIGLK